MQNYIAFDAYGTLFSLVLNRQEVNDLLGKDLHAFMNIWRQKLLEYSWLTTLSSHWEPFNTIVEKALLYSCDITGKNPETIVPIMMEIYRNPVLFPEIKETLSALTSMNCQIFVLSNGEKSSLNQAIKRNGIDHLIAKVFSASEVQKYKVHPAVYSQITNALSVHPSEIYFVSSNSWDIFGASRYGFKTLWLNHNQNVFDKLIECPFKEIKSITEIQSLLL